MNFYREAGTILDKLSLKKGTIKGLCLKDEVRDKKKMYAVICETLKYKDIINQLLESVQFWKLEKKFTSKKNLILVLVHDLLFSQRGIQAPPGPLKDLILKYKIPLKAELTKLKVKRNVQSNKDLIQHVINVNIPRYIRVNTIKITTKEVIQHFINEGYTFVENKNINWSNRKQQYITIDDHINDLLLLPSHTDLHNHPLLLNGKIILQDKASCFPAYILNPPEGATCIDACAAPGNKTSHLAMLMGNKGKIFALDLDPQRLETLKKLTNRAGCSIIHPMQRDFLTLDPNDLEFSKVEYLLLDPSCSGSGIVSRLDYLVDSEDKSEENPQDQSIRLKALAEFQTQVIEHAFKFPKAKYVVYSTCSIHMEENEAVVQTILKKYQKEWQLVKALEPWPRRGIVEKTLDSLNYEEASKLIRCDPQLDATNGFFVALFQRIGAEDRLSIQKVPKIEVKSFELTKDPLIINQKRVKRPLEKEEEKTSDKKIIDKDNKIKEKEKQRVRPKGKISRKKRIHYPVTLK